MPPPNNPVRSTPLPTRTPTPTLRMRLSCNFVNVYTIVNRVQYTRTRVYTHASPNRQPREDPRESRVSDRSADKSARILVRVRLVDDSRAEVGEDVRVGVGVRVCVMECNHNNLGQVVHTHVPLSPSSIYRTVEWASGTAGSSAWMTRSTCLKLARNLPARTVHRDQLRAQFARFRAWENFTFFKIIDSRLCPRCVTHSEYFRPFPLSKIW